MTKRERCRSRVRDRLSEHLDGHLAPEERTLVERHLERCPECARTLEELAAVVARAGRAGEHTPAEDLWPGIAARIGAAGGEHAAGSKHATGTEHATGSKHPTGSERAAGSGRAAAIPDAVANDGEQRLAEGGSGGAGLRLGRRRVQLGELVRFAPQLAAGVALVWLSAAHFSTAGASSNAGEQFAAAQPTGAGQPSGAGQLAGAGEQVAAAQPTGAGQPPATGLPALPASAGAGVAVPAAANAAGAPTTAEEYAELIAAMERALFEADPPLPAPTVARLRRALITIDRAIEDARAALLEVPDNPYLRQHMTTTLQRKTDFLRQAAQLAVSD